MLAFSVWTIYDLKQKYDVMHPNWMILAALLLPLPVSLLAGKLVSMVFPPSDTHLEQLDIEVQFGAGRDAGPAFFAVGKFRRE